MTISRLAPRRLPVLWLIPLVAVLVAPGGVARPSADGVLAAAPAAAIAPSVAGVAGVSGVSGGSGVVAAAAAAPVQPRITGIAPLTHEVFAYLPYWRLDSQSATRIQYDLLSTIAFFGLGIKKSGAIDTDWIGYKEYVGPDAAAVTDAAHAHGVRVVPTFQLFDMNDGAPKMTAFLDDTARQDRFIGEALDLMAARLADGASFDFEPNKAVNDRATAYVAFIARFRTAMLARFPDATLTNATSAGAGKKIIKGLVPLVDHQMLMTYNYRSAGSANAGAIAPLDNTERTVKIHIARALEWAPASSLLLGVPYYGYDWPVKTKAPNAEVRTKHSKYGSPHSVTYTSARDFLAAHPKVIRRYDALEGSGFYTYYDKDHSTYRQVYFEDENSLADKYDYAIVTGLGGVGIWTLENDRGYGDLNDVLREKFYAPIHDVSVKASVLRVKHSGGVVTARVVTARIHVSAAVTGTVPERGSFRWTIRDRAGKLIRKGSWKTQTIYPAKRDGHYGVPRLGTAVGLHKGKYTLRVRFVSTNATWRSDPADFHQPY